MIYGLSLLYTYKYINHEFIMEMYLLSTLTRWDEHRSAHVGYIHERYGSGPHTWGYIHGIHDNL